MLRCRRRVLVEVSVFELEISLSIMSRQGDDGNKRAMKAEATWWFIFHCSSLFSHYSFNVL